MKKLIFFIVAVTITAPLLLAKADDNRDPEFRRGLLGDRVDGNIKREGRNFGRKNDEQERNRFSDRENRRDPDEYRGTRSSDDHRRNWSDREIRRIPSNVHYEKEQRRTRERRNIDARHHDHPNHHSIMNEKAQKMQKSQENRVKSQGHVIEEENRNRGHRFERNHGHEMKFDAIRPIRGHDSITSKEANRRFGEKRPRDLQDRQHRNVDDNQDPRYYDHEQPQANHPKIPIIEHKNRKSSPGQTNSHKKEQLQKTSKSRENHLRQRRNFEENQNPRNRDHEGPRGNHIRRPINEHNKNRKSNQGLNENHSCLPIHEHFSKTEKGINDGRRNEEEDMPIPGGFPVREKKVRKDRQLQKLKNLEQEYKRSAKHHKQQVINNEHLEQPGKQVERKVDDDMSLISAVDSVKSTEVLQKNNPNGTAMASKKDIKNKKGSESEKKNGHIKKLKWGEDQRQPHRGDSRGSDEQLRSHKFEDEHSRSRG